VSWVRSAHHVLGIEHLLGELGHGKCSVLLGASGGQGSESSHEEVETGEGDKVDSEFSQVRVQLSWESKAACNSRDGSRDQVVKITISGGGELQGSETDIVQGFVVDAHNLISVFNELMDGKSSIVWFNDGIGHLGRWHDGEGAHDSVWVFFSDLGDQESSHTGTSTTTKRVGDLETLEAIAAFCFLSDDIQNGVNEFGSLGIMSLSPVVTGSGLTEDEVVRSEELSERSSSHGVHGSWLKIHEHCSGDVSATSSFVIVNVYSLQLQIGVTVVGSGGVDSVFVGDDFPELGTNLVSALSTLDMNDFSHLY